MGTMESDKKDDELTIDFSKLISSVKKVFKTDKKESHHEPSNHTHHDSPTTSNESKDDDFSIDAKAAMSFVKKYHILLLLLIPLCLSLWINLSPMDLPISEQWAQNSVNNAYRQQITAQINQQYPNLPPDNRNALVDRQMEQAIKEQKAAYDAQIEQVSQQFKAHWQDGKGYTYMPDIDTYFYLRYARNIVETGMYGDELRDGEEWDNHMLAPEGHKIKKSMHPYVLAYLYKVMHIFNSDITLMQAAGYYPIIFLLMSIVAAFFIGYRFAGEVGGLVSAMILLVNPTILGKTVFGHSDTDAYQIFFPLVIIWALVEAYRAEDLKKKIGLSALTGAIMGIYSFAWEGWWYLFDFIGAAIVIYLIVIIGMDIIKKRHKDILKNEYVKNISIVAGIGVVVSGIIVSIVHGPKRFFTAPLEPLMFSTIDSAILHNIWPNVYTTVAELNNASTAQIIGAVGGKALLAFSILGMILLALKKEAGRDRRQYLLYFILIAIWYGGVFYAAQKGVRFILLIIPPFAIAFGTAAGLLWQKTRDFLHKHLHVSKKISMALVIIILVFFFWGQVKIAKTIASNDVPMINDAWVSAMENIKTDSQPDAIINSWWDFGHHFKYLADRAVTSDGASQNRPQAHWIGRVLLTGNEREAVGILRMLDCGGNTGPDMLAEHLDDTKRAVDIIYDMIILDRPDAKSVLEENDLPEDLQEKLLERTHCDPPEDYFIASQDMIGKAGVWSHFGGWNFARAHVWSNLKDLPKDEAIPRIMEDLDYTKEEAEKIYFDANFVVGEQAGNTWISPWPGYFGTGSCVADNEKNTLICTNNLGGRVLQFKVDAATMNVTIENSAEKLHPNSFVFSNETGFHEKKFEKNTFGYSFGLINQGGSFQSIVMSEELAPSMFTRMFFYGGIGLRYFDTFDTQRTLSGILIYTYKVDWEGTDEILPVMSAATEEEEEEVLASMEPESTHSPDRETDEDASESESTEENESVEETEASSNLEDAGGDGTEGETEE